MVLAIFSKDGSGCTIVTILDLYQDSVRACSNDDEHSYMSRLLHDCQVVPVRPNICRRFRCQGKGMALGKLLVCPIEHHTVKTCKERSYVHVLGVGTGWKWVASFTLRSFYRADRAAGAELLRSSLGPVVGLDTVSLCHYTNWAISDFRREGGIGNIFISSGPEWCTNRNVKTCSDTWPKAL
jgi:hypothetical protein